MWPSRLGVCGVVTGAAGVQGTAHAPRAFMMHADKLRVCLEESIKIAFETRALVTMSSMLVVEKPDSANKLNAGIEWHRLSISSRMGRRVCFMTGSLGDAGFVFCIDISP